VAAKKQNKTKKSTASDLRAFFSFSHSFLSLFSGFLSLSLSLGFKRMHCVCVPMHDKDRLCHARILNLKDLNIKMMRSENTPSVDIVAFIFINIETTFDTFS